MNSIELTPAEREALSDFAIQQGIQWRMTLLQMWEYGSYWGTATNAGVLNDLCYRIVPSARIAVLRRIKTSGLAI